MENLDWIARLLPDAAYSSKDKGKFFSSGVASDPPSNLYSATDQARSMLDDEFSNEANLALEGGRDEGPSPGNPPAQIKDTEGTSFGPLQQATEYGMGPIAELNSAIGERFDFQLRGSEDTSAVISPSDTRIAAAGVGPCVPMLVSTTADESFDGGSLAAETADGGGLSLREAIGLANAAAGADMIEFSAALTGSTITLTSGELLIVGDLTIDGDTTGDNKADITISGDADLSGTPTAGDSRIFRISGSDTDARLLSLDVSDGFPDASSGAISVGSDTTLTLIDSTVRDSQASSSGGGLQAIGGNIYAYNSTISGNVATTEGGGVSLVGGSHVFVNTTVYGNTSNSFGGGFDLIAGATLSLYSSTVTGNRSDANGDGSAGGGGLALVGFNTSSVQVYNSVVAGNTAGMTFIADDVASTVDASTNSFFGTVETIATDGGGNINGGGDPQLGELLDNGGTTLTLSPLDGSPLIGAGSNLALPADLADLDQDGNTTEDLPLDAREGLRIVGGTVDIGAVEQTENETITGTDADNNIIGGMGNDKLNGGAGADVLDGGAGIDTADYSDSALGVTVRLWNGTGVGGDAQGDTLVDIENVTGSNRGDLLAGDSAANVLRGLSGRDTLNAGGGNDTLNGGASADDLIGGNGIDTADYSGSSAGVQVRLWNGTGVGGQAEGDTLTEIENVTGSGKGDLLAGNSAVNVLAGLAGNDTISAGGGNDVLIGGTGADDLIGGTGKDTADYSGSGAGVQVRLWNGTGLGGQAQGDTLTEIEHVTGSAKNDLLAGNSAANVLIGLSGNDTLSGGGGGDVLIGGAGADDLIGGNGTDKADYSGSGAGVSVRLWNGTGQGGDAQGDTLSEIENLVGSNSADLLAGNSGANVIVGRAGNDVINSGGGADTVTGGGGIDTFVFGNNSGANIITDFSSNNAEDIDLSAVTSITDFADLVNNHLVNSGGTAQIVDGANSILLQGVAFADVGAGQLFSEDDFDF